LLNKVLSSQQETLGHIKIIHQVVVAISLPDLFKNLGIEYQIQYKNNSKFKDLKENETIIFKDEVVRIVGLDLSQQEKEILPLCVPDKISNLIGQMRAERSLIIEEGVQKTAEFFRDKQGIEFSARETNTIMTALFEMLFKFYQSIVQLDLHRENGGLVGEFVDIKDAAKEPRIVLYHKKKNSDVIKEWLAHPIETGGRYAEWREVSKEQDEKRPVLTIIEKQEEIATLFKRTIKFGQRNNMVRGVTVLRSEEEYYKESYKHDSVTLELAEEKKRRGTFILFPYSPTEGQEIFFSIISADMLDGHTFFNQLESGLTRILIEWARFTQQNELFGKVKKYFGSILHSVGGNLPTEVKWESMGITLQGHYPEFTKTLRQNPEANDLLSSIRDCLKYFSEVGRNLSLAKSPADLVALQIKSVDERGLYFITPEHIRSVIDKAVDAYPNFNGVVLKTDIEPYVENISDITALIDIEKTGGKYVVFNKEVSENDKKQLIANLGAEKAQLILDLITRSTRVKKVAEPKIIFDIPKDSSLKVLCDVPQLSDAVRELVRNSIKYADYRKKEIEITVTLSLDEAYPKLLLKIKDNSVGMTKEELIVALEEGGRTDHAKLLEEGTGIGLAGIKEIFLMHFPREALEDSVFSIKSESGSGTEVVGSIRVL
jgi:signal transduction histidine kinase